MLTDEHLETLADKLVDKLKSNNHTLWIDPETHADQHAFIAQMIEDRQERATRRKALEDKIAGSIVLSAVMGLIYLIGSGAMDWMRSHMK